uniref:Secreted protein n=1 Tax=Solanum demissum TaxID=50514 RepID=Q0KIK6_SOLDE|nr:hypothetical protein SDM1_55t00013 [Solanum demissum]
MGLLILWAWGIFGLFHCFCGKSAQIADFAMWGPLFKSRSMERWRCTDIPVQKCERLAMNVFKRVEVDTKEVWRRLDLIGHDTTSTYRGHHLR